MKLTANNLQIEVEDIGRDDRPAVLLIMGLGMQLIGWPDAMVKAFQAAGFRVVRYDNRDAGLSQGFDHVHTGNVVWQSLKHRLGWTVHSAYSLEDMAMDALGVLDALGIRRAHVIGASMGGMIAQHLAAIAPDRVASLVSIMSSSGARGLPGPRADVAAALLKQPADRSEAGMVAHSLKFVRMIESPAYRQGDQAITDRILQSRRRAYRPAGILRQMMAIAADRNRTDVLARIAVPTLVIHGDADLLVPIECGRDTARRIRESQFVSVPGMGHDLPPEVVQILLGKVLPFLGSAKLTPP